MVVFNYWYKDEDLILYVKGFQELYPIGFQNLWVFSIIDALL